MTLLKEGLYVVGTPLGNLADITFRAIDVLRQADLVMAEDTRHTGRLLAHYKIKTRLLSCHNFNEAQRVDRAIAAIKSGKVVALVTDAGMPGISDPGSRVAAACRAADCFVTVIPGPCAVSAAVALSGFGGAAFYFEGFLPRKSGKRRRRLEELTGINVPVILFESPHRFIRLLDELQEIHESCQLFVGRELTKRFEECQQGTAREIKSAYTQRKIKGEFVIVIKNNIT